VIILEHADEDIRERALALFAGKARRAVRLRGDVSIRITSSHEMRELNRRFRRKNKPTDVLSFPSNLPKWAGDIAISAQIAASNAAQLGHSTETELRILILHGLLHLAGYDHETDGGEMQAREAKLRRQLKLPVGLIERTQGPNGKRPVRSGRSGKAGAAAKRGGAQK
jgi:probable rRNA maturation factor